MHAQSSMEIKHLELILGWLAAMNTSYGRRYIAEPILQPKKVAYADSMFGVSNPLSR